MTKEASGLANKVRSSRPKESFGGRLILARLDAAAIVVDFFVLVVIVAAVIAIGINLDGPAVELVTERDSDIDVSVEAKTGESGYQRRFSCSYTASLI